MKRDHMNKLQDLSPRTRWQGWTIVEKDGSIVLDHVFHDPFVWKLKADAQDVIEIEEGQRVMRCELRLIAARKKERK